MTNELFPRGGSPTLWRQRDALALKDVPPELGAEGVSDIGQGAYTVIIAPGTDLLRHTPHQGLRHIFHGKDKLGEGQPMAENVSSERC